MPKFQKIVVGFDHSQQSAWAFEAAARLLSPGGSILVVVAVDGRLPTDLVDELLGGPEIANQHFSWLPFIEALEAATLEKVRCLCAPDLDVTVQGREGTPTVCLMQAASEFGADLIAIGATGHSKFERMLVGSTTQRLARRSTIPVLVHRPGQNWPPHRVLCGVDFSPTSAEAIAWAAAVARRFNATLDLCHAYRGDYAWRGTAVHDEAKRQEATERLETEFTAQGHPEVHWTAHVRVGSPDWVLADAAVARGVDLVCVGTVGRHGIAGALIGNTAERLVRTMPCSILTVPKS
jgi:nucleotide-binding universal stress UspA family protein